VPLQEFIKLLVQRWQLIAAVVAVGVALAVLVTAITPFTYKATANLYVSVDAADAAAAYDGGLFAQQRAAYYAELVPSVRVSQAALDGLQIGITPDQLTDKISAAPRPPSPLLAVSVTDGSPEQAVLLADRVGAAFAALVPSLEGASDDPDGAGAKVTIRTFEPAAAEIERVSPRRQLNLLIGLVAGLLVGIGSALVARAFDRTIRSTSQLARYVGRPVLGTTTRSRSRNRAKPVVQNQPDSAAAEEYRRLRERFEHARGERGAAVIAFTSSSRREGCSTVVCNLAAALVAIGRRVLVVDGNVRDPGISAMFSLQDRPGLADLLEGRSPASGIIWRTNGLDIVPSGSPSGNATDMLAASTASSELEQLFGAYDVVLVDVAPTVGFADATSIARWVDAYVLVVRYGKCSEADAGNAATEIAAMAKIVLGVVLTMVPHGFRSPAPAHSSGVEAAGVPQAEMGLLAGEPGTNARPARR
jgi:tyrosine-protein kinase